MDEQGPPVESGELTQILATYADDAVAAQKKLRELRDADPPAFVKAALFNWGTVEGVPGKRNCAGCWPPSRDTWRF